MVTNEVVEVVAEYECFSPCIGAMALIAAVVILFVLWFRMDYSNGPGSYG